MKKQSKSYRSGYIKGKKSRDAEVKTLENSLRLWLERYVEIATEYNAYMTKVETVASRVSKERP